MTEYDLGKVVGDDGEAGNGIASITKTGTSGLVDTYTITFDDGSTTTFTVTNGSDASVTIQTSWGSTTSDSKVPSEKLTKDTLDTKIAKSSTTGLVKNDGTIMTSGTGSTNYSAGNHTHSGYISTSSTSGLIKNDGSIMTGGTGSSNWAVGNHTHSAYVNPTKVTSWSATVSDDNVASEKLIKDTLDTKQATLVSGTNIKTVNNETLLGSGNITIQGGSSVDIVTAWESTPSDSKVASEKLTKDSLDGKANSTHEHYGNEVFSSIDLSNLGIFTDDSQDAVNLAINNAIGNKISKSQTVGLVKNDGSIDTNTYLTSSAISGMLTSSDIANNLTTTSSGKVLDARQGKALADLIGDAITYINQ